MIPKNGDQLRILVLADCWKYHIGDKMILIANLAWLRNALPSPVTFVIIGSDPLPDYGDVELLDMTLHRLGFKKSRLLGIVSAAFFLAKAFVFKYGIHDRRLLGEPTQILNEICKSDLLFLCGGGNLNSKNWDLLLLRLVTVLAAKILGKRIFSGAQSIGPFFRDSDDRFTQTIVNNADYLLLRDRTSLEWVRSKNGLHLNVRLVPDDAFMLKPGTHVPRTINSLPKPVILTTLQPTLDVRIHRKIASLLDFCISSTGGSVVFLPHRISTSSIDDEDVHSEIIRLMQEKRSTVRLVDKMDPFAVNDLYGYADLVFTTRYHSLVLSLVNGTPSVGIYTDASYKWKLNGLRQSFKTITILDANKESDASLARTMVSTLETTRHRKEVLLESRTARLKSIIGRKQLEILLRNSLGCYESTYLYDKQSP